MTPNLIETIARVCHEANRAYCIQIGDNTQPPWDDAADWQRASAVLGVQFIIDNPTAGPSASHESWLEQKRKDGWTYGPIKDPVQKTHPCFLPYSGLPLEQRLKDLIFGTIARGLLSAFSNPPEEIFHKETGAVSQGVEPPPDVPRPVFYTKTWRKQIDAIIQEIRRESDRDYTGLRAPDQPIRSSRERAIALTKLQEGVMWLGMDLKALNEPNPYPSSYNPATSKIEPTADGLKL